MQRGQRFVPDGTLCPPHGWRQWPTPSGSAEPAESFLSVGPNKCEQDDPSVQQGECAMDHGPWSTAHAHQDLDDRSRQTGDRTNAETEDCDGQSEFHVT